MTADNRLIIRTLPRPGWVTVDWTAVADTDYPPSGQLTGEIELDAENGNMYLRFRNDNDDPFILVLDKQGLRIYESEDLPPNMDSRFGDVVAFNAEDHTPGAVSISIAALLRTSYQLLGDGNGQEWDVNAEYTRGQVELIGDLLGLSGDYEDRADEVLRRVREAGQA